MTSMARGFVLSLILLLTGLLVLPVEQAAAAEARSEPIGPDGGTVSALAVAPGARRTLYAGTRSGLVFRSTDAGASWSLTGPGLPFGSVTSLVVDPGDPAKLYAGLDSGLLAGRGVFRSTDGGRTWSPPDAGLPDASVWSLAMDPRNPSVLLAGTELGVFRTDDGGANWFATSLGAELFQDVRAVVFDPAVPGRAWAAQETVGVFASDDGGLTWTLRNTGFPEALFPAALAIDPSSGTLIVGFSVAPDGRPIYRSTNAGESWTRAPVEMPSINALAVSPGESPTFYAATNTGIFRSVDGGATWTALARQLGSGVTSLAVPPFPASFVYAGSFANGVFKSTDRGASWHRASRGLNAAEILALAVAPSDPAVLYVSADRGVLRSTDQGRTWREINRGISQSLRPHLLQVHPRDPRTVYAAAERGFFWKTTNGGASWRSVSEGEDMGCMDARALAIDPAEPENVYVTGFPSVLCEHQQEEGCLGFRSRDGGESWTCMKGGDRVLAIDPQRPSMLFSGGDRIFRSTDAGRTWRDVAAAFLRGTDSLVQALIVAPRTREPVYAGTSLGIFQSLDAGNTWRPRNFGLPRRPDVYALAVAPSAPRVLYAGVQKYDPVAQTYRGTLFRTLDSASAWELVGAEGLPEGLLQQIQVHPSQPAILFGASDRGGIYRLMVSGDPLP